MFGLGLPELIVILLVVLILFGAKRIPGLAKSLGKALSIFKKEVKETKDDDQSSAQRTDSEETTKDV